MMAVAKNTGITLFDVDDALHRRSTACYGGERKFKPTSTGCFFICQCRPLGLSGTSATYAEAPYFPSSGLMNLSPGVVHTVLIRVTLVRARRRSSVAGWRALEKGVPDCGCTAAVRAGRHLRER